MPADDGGGGFRTGRARCSSENEHHFVIIVVIVRTVKSLSVPISITAKKSTRKRAFTTVSPGTCVVSRRHTVGDRPEIISLSVITDIPIRFP